MPLAELSANLHHWAHDGLAWIGFGTVVGMVAKLIMPGRDPGGAVATLAMGVGGTVIGCSVLMYISGGKRVSPISPIGFVAATAGAFMLLFFYRLLGGRIIHEGDKPTYPGPYYSRRRRRSDADYIR